MTDKDKRRLYLMYKRGYTDQQIASVLCYTESYISNVRRKLGCKSKHQGRPYKYNGMVVASMVEMRRQGMSYRKISERMGIDRNTVYNYVKREGRTKTL